METPYSVPWPPGVALKMLWGGFRGVSGQLPGGSRVAADSLPETDTARRTRRNKRAGWLMIRHRICDRDQLVPMEFGFAGRSVRRLGLAHYRRHPYFTGAPYPWLFMLP
jgi:hypothetical protein